MGIPTEAEVKARVGPHDLVTWEAEWRLRVADEDAAMKKAQAEAKAKSRR